MAKSTFRSPFAWLPIAMSVVALAIVVGYVTVFGAARQADEGTAAHLWQLLMVGQLPLIAWFMAKKVREAPRQGLVVLAVQLVAVLAAAAPVFVLGL